MAFAVRQNLRRRTVLVTWAILLLVVSAFPVARAQSLLDMKVVEVKGGGRGVLLNGETNVKDIGCLLRIRGRNWVQGSLTIRGELLKNVVFVEIFLRKDGKPVFTSSLERREHLTEENAAVCSWSMEQGMLAKSSLRVIAREKGKTTSYSLSFKDIAVQDKEPMWHTVSENEDIKTIGMLYGVPSKLLMEANHLTNGLLEVGRRIVIPDISDD